jgi:hypothetical protein
MGDLTDVFYVTLKLLSGLPEPFWWGVVVGGAAGVFLSGLLHLGR